MTYLPGRAAVRDSGAQPAPHYCTVKVRDDGVREGCPDWPHCLFAANAAEPNDEPEPDGDDVPGLAVSLLSLLGIAAGVFLAVIVLAILLPFVV